MIEAALDKARLSPTDIQYVEAHGTGTAVGDPIEAAAIGAALSKGRGSDHRWAIGSVKTNIGHLEAASGIAGLIKVALSLKHKKLPPSLHFHNPNPAIDFDALGLRVVTSLEPWPEPANPLLKGVNSFGFGGANVECDSPGSSKCRRIDNLAGDMKRRDPACWLSRNAATTHGALSCRAMPTIFPREILRRFATSASRPPSVGRTMTIESLLWRKIRTRSLRVSPHLPLAISDSTSVLEESRAAGPGKIAFVFSGMGPQWWGMGQQLYATERVFRESFDRCDAALRKVGGWSLNEEFAKREAARVASPEQAQVTNFAIQVSLSDLWASYGITPDALMGHSGGAMAAAYLAGVYSLEDAIGLCHHRSRLQGRPSNYGKMLAVGGVVRRHSRISARA